MSISKKFETAHVGDQFADSMAHDSEGRILTFVGLWSRDVTAYVRVGDAFQERVNTVEAVLFEDEDGNIIEVNADDRYGHFPKVDARFAGKVFERREQLRVELARYEAMAKKLEGLGYSYE